MPESIRIFTGTRWTIFTKLPVAFSGGKAVKRDPEPSWMLSTWPVSFRPGIGIDADVHLLAGAHAVELGFLEVGGDPDVRRDDRQDGLTGLHVVALLDVALGDPAILRRGDAGPGQVQRRLVELGAGQRHLRLELAHLGLGLADILRHQLGLAHCRLRLVHLGVGGAQRGVGGVDLLLGGGLLRQAALAPRIGIGLEAAGACRGQRGLGGGQLGGVLLLAHSRLMRALASCASATCRLPCA